MDNSYPGIQKFTVPQAGTGTYRIKAYGPGGGQRWGNEIYGAGAIVQGDVQLNGGDTLWVLVGQKSDFYKLKSYGYWTGGSGGTFVAKSIGNDNLSTSTPLIVAGGGSGHRSSNEKEDNGAMDGWCSTDAQDAATHSGSWNTALVGTDTVETSNANVALGFGYGGKGGYGGQGGNSGASGSPSNSLTSKSHTAGGGAGFYGDGRASLDTRGYSGSDAPVPAKAFRNGGRGGLFDPPNWSFTIANNGGFGGGGSGSWGGTGGGGGYSGGGGDPNSGFGGGGGSFCEPGTNGDPNTNGCSCTWGSGTWTSSDTYTGGAGNLDQGKVEITFISS